MSWADLLLVDRANDVLIDRCLRESGFTNPILDLERPETAPIEERRLGIWVEANAASYGYGFPPNSFADEGNALLDSQSEEWGKAQATCYQTTDLVPALVYEDAFAQSDGSAIAVGAKGRTESYSYAALQPEWRDARSDWWACLRENGVTPVTGDDDWAPEVPSDREAAVRVALIDIACKQETNLIHRITDKVAQYETAYVVKNEAALLAQRDAVDSVIAEAEAILDGRA
jgi:hypothetical protein